MIELISGFALAANFVLTGWAAYWALVCVAEEEWQLGSALGALGAVGVLSMVAIGAAL